MSLDAGGRWTCADQVALRRDGDGAILLDLKNQQYYELNATGLRVWELLASGASIAETAERLRVEFDQAGGAHQAVVELVEELAETGLLHPAGRAPGWVARARRRLR